MQIETELLHSVEEILIFFNSDQQIIVVIKKCLHRERKRSHVPVEEQLSCCALCQDVLKDPVSTSCGHWFCRQCISSYWDQSASSGHSSCPQCGERSRTRAGLQTASQSSSVQSKSEHLYIWKTRTNVRHVSPPEPPVLCPILFPPSTHLTTNSTQQWLCKLSMWKVCQSGD